MEAQYPGLFIVIEGIDGTGKSTQAKMLQKALQDTGAIVVLDHEPSDGPYGKILRESATTGRLSPQEELDLFHKDRKHHVDELILPALKRGETVILDRYYFSTMAYQGQRGFDREEIRQTNLTFAPNPDILFILDLEVDEARKRIGIRGDTTNEFEKRDALQYCRDTFLSVNEADFAHIIDASKSIDLVHQDLVTIATSK